MLTGQSELHVYVTVISSPSVKPVLVKVVAVPVALEVSVLDRAVAEHARRLELGLG